MCVAVHVGVCDVCVSKKKEGGTSCKIGETLWQGEMGGVEGWMKREPTRWHCCVVNLISLSSLFLSLCFYLMSLPLPPPIPSLLLFYLPPLRSLSLTLPLSMHSMYDGAGYTAGN